MYLMRRILAHPEISSSAFISIDVNYIRSQPNNFWESKQVSRLIYKWKKVISLPFVELQTLS